MKKLAIILAIAGLVEPALAADMPVKAPPPSAVYSWTGFYLGGNLGYAWNNGATVTHGEDDPFDPPVFINPPSGTPLGPTSLKTHGARAIGGVQAGYNWQLTPLWVAGLETDFQASDINTNGSSSNVIIRNVPGLGPLLQTVNEGRDLKWYGTVRGRLGALVAPSLLLYGTAGFAYGQVSENGTSFLSVPGGTVGTLTFINCTFPVGSGTTCATGSSSRVATGWTAGGGAEWAITRNVSIKGEYLFMQFGGNSLHILGPSVPGVGPVPSLVANYNNFDIHTVRVGLNYQFH